MVDDKGNHKPRRTLRTDLQALLFITIILAPIWAGLIVEMILNLNVP